MKITLVCALALLPCLAFAQSTAPSDGDRGKGWHHHEESPQEQLATLTTKLGLSTTQQGQIGPVLESRDQQVKAIWGNASLSETEKHEQAKAVFESTKTQIESFLTPAQVTEFEEMHGRHHEKAE